MKLKTAALLLSGTLIFGAANYNKKITLIIDLPSPAQIVDAAEKVAEELKQASADSTIGFEINNSEKYVIRSSWEDLSGQIGEYTELQAAVNNCPVGYYVYTDDGSIAYDPAQH